MQTFDIKLGDQWVASAQAFDSAANQARSFIHAPQWACDSPAILAMLSASPDGTHITVRGDAIGQAILSVTADSITTQVQVNVLPPYDTIQVSFAKAA